MKISAAVPGTPMIVSGGCYHRYPGGNCIGGYLSGLDFTCQNVCDTGIVDTDAVEASDFAVLTSVLVRGRLTDLASSRAGTPLSTFPVKLLLPCGLVLTDHTDLNGAFSISVESVNSLKGQSDPPHVVEMGDLPFDPLQTAGEPQLFYVLKLHAKG
jgi:hypothetical protein